MSDTYATWLPSPDTTASGIDDAYLQIIPDEFPDGDGYIDKNTDNYQWSERLIVANVAAALRKQIYWFQERYFPQDDTTAWLLEHWEDDLKLDAEGSTTDRINRILFALRARGTSTKELVLMVLYPLFTKGEISLENADDYIDAVYPSLANAWGHSIQLKAVPKPTTCSGVLYAVHGISSTEAMAVGQYAQVATWDGSEWALDTTITGTAITDLESFYACHYVTSTDIWAGGAGSVIYNWDGDYWREYNTSGTTWGITHIPTTSGSQNRTYIVGDDGLGQGYISEFYNNQWNDIKGTYNPLYDIKAIVSGTSGYLYYCGSNGDVYKYDVQGDNLTDISPDGVSTFYSICASHDGHIQVNGMSGVGYYSSDYGTTWTSSGTAAKATPANLNIFAGDGWDEDRFIIVGASGIVFRNHDGSYQQIYSDCPPNGTKACDWRGVWVDTHSCTVIMVGSNGNINHSPGLTPTSISGVENSMIKAQTSAHFYAINGGLDPDYRECYNAMNFIQPVGAQYTTGSGQYFLWGNDKAGWSQGVWK